MANIQKGKVNNMPSNVIILPKTTDQSLLAQYYSMADVFVICSKSENFPTTCVEAQCCGTPVVGFDTGGTKETSLISENDFVPYGNLEGLKEKIKEKLNSDYPDLADQAQKEYSSETMARRYMEEYDKNGRKERVLLIDVNCKYSSTGKIVYDLYKSIRADGREAAVCYGRGPKIIEENIYKFGIDAETYLHAGLSRITGYNGCFSYFSTLRLINFIENYKPDIIHIHELHAYFVNIKMLLSYIKARDIPVVWTFHCEYMYTGKCGYAYECDRYKDTCGKCPELRSYPKSVFYDKTEKMLQAKKEMFKGLKCSIITPSQWLADRTKESFLANREIGVIHNGIDTKLFSAVDDSKLKELLSIPADNKVILSLAPNIMSERKGGEWIIRLSDLLKDENITFVMVGKV